MGVWLLMLFSIILINFLIPDAIGKKKKNLIFLGFAYCIIVFVVGSRSAFMSNSSDLVNYYRCFDRALTWPLNQMLDHYTMEDGYIILNKILAWLVPWNYFIGYFEAAFCTFVMFWYIYRNADSVVLAVIIYICVGPWQFFLTGFRQALAISICFIGLEFMKKHKQMWDLAALGCIFLAATLHGTAWVFITVFLIRKIKITKRVVIYAGVLTLFMFVFIDDIVELGNKLLDKNYRLTYYGNEFGGIVPILFYVCALILCYLIWTWSPEYLEENGFEVAILIFGMCIYILRYQSLIMERISFYFTPVITIVLSNAITRQRTKVVRNIALVVCIALCMGLYMYRAMVQLGEYHFYWEYMSYLELYELP